MAKHLALNEKAMGGRLLEKEILSFGIWKA